MGWQDLLAKPEDTFVAPWLGGGTIQHGARTWQITGRRPREHGWHRFSVSGTRKTSWQGAAVDVDASTYFEGAKLVRGYLVGDRLLPDGMGSVADVALLLDRSEAVHLVDSGLDRFTRVAAARHVDGSLIYVRQEFPLGPEQAVLDVYLDRGTDLRAIPGVTPALDLAFRFEMWQRERAEEHRRAVETARRAEEERQAAEARRRDLMERLGDGASRRALARIDFGEAAAAALRVAGAEILDWRDSTRRGEAVVRFRFRDRRFECVCTKDTLHIVDSGVCLTGNDRLFTLESLPAVLAEAMDTHRLHVFRHADDRGNDWAPDSDPDTEW